MGGRLYRHPCFCDTFGNPKKHQPETMNNEKLMELSGLVYGLVFINHRFLAHGGLPLMTFVLPNSFKLC